MNAAERLEKEWLAAATAALAEPLESETLIDCENELATLRREVLEPMAKALRFANVRALQAEMPDSDLIERIDAALAKWEGA